MAVNQYKLERPRNKLKLIEMITDAVTDAECARTMGVTEGTIYAFKRRHAEEIATRRQQLESRLTELAIANKYFRVREAQSRWDGFKSVRQARATDTRYEEPGYNSGLMVHRTKALGSGPNMQLVDEYELDTAMSAEMRQLEYAVANELGQIPRTGDTGSGPIVLIREMNVVVER
jgi:hypothetical protein